MQMRPRVCGGGGGGEWRARGSTGELSFAFAVGVVNVVAAGLGEEWGCEGRREGGFCEKYSESMSEASGDCASASYLGDSDEGYDEDTWGCKRGDEDEWWRVRERGGGCEAGRGG